MQLRGLKAAVRPVAALEDPVRRRLYGFVRRARGPVTRDDAAAATGISRKLAAFHLDKLAERGLLTFSFGRPSGRGGPGAGRTSKLYRPSDLELAVSIPERHYDLAGRLLVEAIEEQLPGESGRDAALRIAEERGRRLGADVAATVRVEGGAGRALEVARDVLERNGYEPYVADDGTLRLANCPFHALAQQSTTLVCGMNQRFIAGLTHALAGGAFEAVLEPTPGECCVTIRARSAEDRATIRPA